MRYALHHSIVALVIALVIGISPVLVSTGASGETYDVVITNGRIIDGTGNPWFRADVGIRDGRIMTVGRINPSEAKKVIDAQNHIVAPGFIDVHTHVESLFNLPAAENFVRMGVTTLITGNCGGSTTNVAFGAGSCAYGT